ncbi:PREDICTED: lysM and putative peptidoglycan-binding domain-containing protein 3 isoform X1 [Trachymyrmex cornetzi]|uniref:LysM and putative peptidoglycan-binding domain-containing protein 3 n=1 Tax=Trachymyrmex cornetzi TaxID=471704 RepID=A0A151IUS7_9HYME|nr:PREDICTED: lysM and putative peptidoglycan-binding domain-containing protein 3 isoform X1 [Trachymyrmex cornetzi]KYN11206.1 LysM and putative peptidoglycan-binding domain-containing protein 3 [Trachymyrmex cornetzi]
MPQKLMNSTFEEQKSVRQTVHLRGRESSPYYVFLHSDDEGSTDEDNISLQTIKRPTSLCRKIQVINVQIKPEDTLQALALRYRCTISELKRINKIDKENEIYAKPYIKVPVQPFSILTETSHESQGNNNAITMSEQCQEEAPAITDEQLIDLSVTSTSTESSNTEINTIILNSVCEPLSSYNGANTPEIFHTEHDALLDDVENTEIAESCETNMFKCSGDNWGLSWTQLLVFSLLLSFAGPIIYILYIAEYSAKTNITVSN